MIEFFVFLVAFVAFWIITVVTRIAFEIVLNSVLPSSIFDGDAVGCLLVVLTLAGGTLLALLALVRTAPWILGITGMDGTTLLACVGAAITFHVIFGLIQSFLSQ